MAADHTEDARNAKVIPLRRRGTDRNWERAGGGGKGPAASGIVAPLPANSQRLFSACSAPVQRLFRFRGSPVLARPLFLVAS
jgi:hypothetical protein